MLKIEPIFQQTNSDCGKACVAMVLDYHKVPLKGVECLANAIDGVQVRTIEAFFREKGFTVTSGNFTYKLLEHFYNKKVPVICLLQDHYVLVKEVKSFRIVYNCPIKGEVKCTAHQFKKKWHNQVDGDVLFNWGIACMTC
jgi:ABC-type bacteriocin/lantibiotic exporter with double-glycine peptidase domain